MADGEDDGVGLALAAVSAATVLVADLKAQYATRGITAVVGTRIRDPRPQRFTRLRLNGGGRGVVTSKPMITVECWAETDTAAEELALITEGLIDTLPDRVGICYKISHVGGLADIPDPDSGNPRYVFTKVLHLRKHAI